MDELIDIIFEFFRMSGLLTHVNRIVFCHIIQNYHTFDYAAILNLNHEIWISLEFVHILHTYLLTQVSLYDRIFFHYCVNSTLNDHLCYLCYMNAINWWNPDNDYQVFCEWRLCGTLLSNHKKISCAWHNLSLGLTVSILQIKISL